LTTKLATTRSGIVIEGLNAQDMGKNHILASSVRDAAFGMFREMLTYKCDWYGCGLEVAPRFFPSTQTCSECGTVKTGTDKLTLSQRTFRCDACGFTLGRDVIAARVLAAMYGSEVTIKVAASWAETVNACGAESTDIGVGSRCETRRGEAGTRIYSGRRP
jgi:putative transposase